MRPTSISVRRGGRQCDDWVTPRDFVRALGAFDLDPCAAVGQAWLHAPVSWTVEDDGLTRPWFGRVWLNPPYSRVRPWMERLADHGLGVALVPASVETNWFRDTVWLRADAVTFLAGRLTFCRPDGSATQGNVGRGLALVEYGGEPLRGLPGVTVTGWRA